METIRDVRILTGKLGRVTGVKVLFGPHYYLGIEEHAGKLGIVLGATHYGFKARADQVGDGLEKVIELVREHFPEWVDDNGLQF